MEEWKCCRPTASDRLRISRLPAFLENFYRQPLACTLTLAALPRNPPLLLRFSQAGPEVLPALVTNLPPGTVASVAHPYTTCAASIHTLECSRPSAAPLRVFF